MRLLRNLYHRVLLVPGVDWSFALARRNCATVFMCHRFRDLELGTPGFDPAVLRKGLEYLRKHKYEMLSLGDLFSRLKDGRRTLGGAVVFTIDDGYVDHAAVAAPMFAEFDCPVTTFLTTGFVDGTLWMWWDKIEYVFSKTKRATVAARLGPDVLTFDCNIAIGRASAGDEFVGRCKLVDEDEKLAAIARLADAADVELPSRPPAAYSPMTWDDARRCESRGMTFGPHTVTHPILTHIPPERSAWEIKESWERLCEELRRPVPVFCYPNGQWSSFGEADTRVLRDIGFLGAVVGEWGFADRKSFEDGEDGAFRTRRLGFPETVSDLVQYVSGIERCKQLVRGWL